MPEDQAFWLLRDQSQLAVGFDNWNFSEADVAWLSGNAGGAGTGNAAVGSPVGSGNGGGEFGGNDRVGMEGMNGLGTGGGGGGPVGGGGGGLSGIGLNGYGSMAGYNEGEWYR